MKSQGIPATNTIIHGRVTLFHKDAVASLCQICTAIATHSDPKVTLSQEAVTPSAQPLFKAWLLERAIQSIRCSRASRHYGRLQVPDAGLIRERLEADCTPYAVHGDGVQVSSVSQYGSTGVPAQ